MNKPQILKEDKHSNENQNDRRIPNLGKTTDFETTQITTKPQILTDRQISKKMNLQMNPKFQNNPKFPNKPKL